MEKLISVIIPCYNAGQYLDISLGSVYEQDYPNVELIVVNDGSVDNSEEIILAWKERFARKGYSMKYLYQDNQGPAAATSAGLGLVSGQYLTLLDADDCFLPGSLRRRAAYLDMHMECDAMRSNGWVVRGEHRHLFVYGEAEKRCEDIFLALLRGETNNWAGSYMVRTEALFNFYPQREIYASRYGQNLQLLLPLAYKKPVGFLDEPLMNYIQQAESLSHTADASMAKKRELENAAGYRDIRVHMLELIAKDAYEKQVFMRNIDGAYWRYIMQIADRHGDIDLLKTAYKNLKTAEKPMITDKIMRYQRTAPPVAIALRIVNKLGRTVFRKG